MVPNTIEFVPLHKTFAAECRNVDFTKDISQETTDIIKSGLDKYGVLIFRNTGLSDDDYVRFCAHLGEMDPPREPNARVKNPWLTSPSNIRNDESVVQVGEFQYYAGKASAIFHCDGSYDPRRIRYTSIKAVQLPPPESGGGTEFCDTRAAWDDLDDDLKGTCVGKVATHSWFNTRKAAAPDYPSFKALEPMKHFMARQYLTERQPRTGRNNLYIGYHIEYIEGMNRKKSSELFDKLMAHAVQPNYLFECTYKNPGDVVIWDNLSVMHRAAPGSYVGKYKRDMRRATMLDCTPEEWGLNVPGTERIDTTGIIKEVHAQVTGNDSVFRIRETLDN